MEKRLGKIEDTLVDISKSMVRYNVLLENHIEGVQQNRTRVAKIEEEMDYVTGHVHEVQGGMKLLKIVGSIIAIAGGSLGILKLMGVI